jgi:hypothetical protein
LFRVKATGKEKQSTFYAALHAINAKLKINNYLSFFGVPTPCFGLNMAILWEVYDEKNNGSSS